LVVLDEARLCPPFEALLRALAEDDANLFGLRAIEALPVVARRG
jgi:hypothetical protein